MTRSNDPAVVAASPRGAARGGVMSLVAVVLLAAVAGCGPSAPFSMAKTSGTVLYEDGAPIPAEQVFVRLESLEPPRDPKTHPRPAQGYADPATGAFEYLTTYKHADGAVRGRHKVIVVATPAAGEPAPVDAVYSRADTSPIEIEVKGQPLEIRVARPSASSATP